MEQVNPLAPEHDEIKESMLSDYQKKLAKDLDVKVGGRKLCLTLQDKKHYICHYRNLKYYSTSFEVRRRN